MSVQERTSQSESNKQKDQLKNKSTEFGNKNDPNFDPSRQNSGIDAGKPSNPNTPTIKDLNQDGKGLHPVVMTDDRLKASGKDVGGNPNAPIVTLNPTSRPVDSQGNLETETVSDVLDLMFTGDFVKSKYEKIDDMKAGIGLLIPISAGKTIDQIVLEAKSEAKRLNDYWSVEATNEDGERILDTVIIEEFKRNDDKTIQLDGANKPIVGANQRNIPRRIQIRQYVAKVVMKDDDKISEDGALIVRVF